MWRCGQVVRAFAALVAVSQLSAPARAQVVPTWQPLTQNIDFCQGTLLLTDGSVFSYGTRFVPDANGNYVNMKSASSASLPSPYSPGAFAAAVLPDGRAIYEGGECGTRAECQANIDSFTNMGAIYDPVANLGPP